MKSFYRVILFCIVVCFFVTTFVFILPSQARAELTLQQAFDNYFGVGVIDTTKETKRTTFPAGKYDITLIAKFTGAPHAPNGWYPVSSRVELNEVFSADAQPLTTKQIDILEEFGLWIATFSLWRSEPSFNSDKFDHFVVFDIPSGGYAIGIEDLPGGGDVDFQDHILAYVIKQHLPTPFLDLPWDYEGKGLSFNEAALSINSYFDHEYPLLGFYNLDKQCPPAPIELPRLTTTFRGDRIGEPEGFYHCHDGYDYGKKAKANLGDPVLAAAPGIATYVNSCSACGNMIIIDHGNGYQTRYMHLQQDGLITKTPGEKISVNTKQQIGLVGATGNTTGAHIHLGVFEDKNKDGNFDDNVPDGVTDPFGWQSKEPDPWPAYSFFYNGLQRTGNKSYYLWKNKIANLNATLTANGGIFNNGRYKVEFPKDATNQNLNLNILSEPIAKLSKEIQSIGSTITVTAKDALGNLVTTFKNLFTITVDFSSFDLSKYNTNTLSLYSSSDGINWTKEPTIVDYVTNTATSQIDHLTHFALMAERKDIVPPTTTATLSGQQGQPNWFGSDVTVNLDAKDNENGLGVDYTLYKIQTTENTTDWTTYTNPLTFTTEGHHKIEFYSVDKDENVATVKSTEFDIDKTIPEARIFIDQDKQDIVVEGIDQNQTTVERQDNTETKKKDDAIYIISDQAGNTVKIDVRDRDRDKEKQDRFSIYSMQYNQDSPIELPDNKLIVEYKGKKDKLNVDEQRFEIKEEVKIRIKYNSKKNQSTISTKVNEEEKVKEIKDGLVLLQLTTERGTLNYSY